MRLMVGLAAAAALCIATPAHTQPAPAEQPMLESPGSALRNCDGFGGASASGDGILRPRRSVDALGRMAPTWQHSIEYCDRALANIEQNYPQHRIRRISLLQSRAIHRLIAGDATAAIADLDRADAAADLQDEDYARTLGVNSKLIRAMAVTLAGDPQTGAALALEGRSARPYSRAALIAALMVLHPDTSRDQIALVLEDLVRMNPEFETLQLSLAAGAWPERDLRAFFMLMLDAESPNRRARGWEASRSLAAGCPRSPGPELVGARVQFCLFSLTDTGAMMDERVLLRLARLAADHHMSRFRIDRRADVSHWADHPFSRIDDQSGLETRIVASLVEDGVDCPHCMDAGTIIADLEPRYGPPTPER
jgi:hypothetical protein